MEKFCKQKPRKTNLHQNIKSTNRQFVIALPPNLVGSAKNRYNYLLSIHFNKNCQPLSDAERSYEEYVFAQLLFTMCHTKIYGRVQPDEKNDLQKLATFASAKSNILVANYANLWERNKLLVF